MISVINKLSLLNKTIRKQLQYLSLIRNNKTPQLAEKMASQCGLCEHIVWMDLEMTGLNEDKDQILEISCLITDKNLNVIAEGPCYAINYPELVFQQMNQWCMKQHYESGLIDKCLKSNITISSCEELILNFLKRHIPKRECPLAGSTIYMDR